MKKTETRKVRVQKQNTFQQRLTRDRRFYSAPDLCNALCSLITEQDPHGAMGEQRIYVNDSYATKDTFVETAFTSAVTTAVCNSWFAAH